CSAAKANVKNPPKEFTTLAIRMAKGAAGFVQGAVAVWAKDAAGGDPALLKGFTETDTRGTSALPAHANSLRKKLTPPRTRRDGIVRDRSGKLLGQAAVRRHGRGASVGSPGPGRGEPSEGLCCVCRDGEKDRPDEDSRGSHEVAFRPASHGRRSDPIRTAEP